MKKDVLADRIATACQEIWAMHPVSVWTKCDRLMVAQCPPDDSWDELVKWDTLENFLFLEFDPGTILFAEDFLHWANGFIELNRHNKELQVSLQ